MTYPNFSFNFSIFLGYTVYLLVFPSCQNSPKIYQYIYGKEKSMYKWTMCFKPVLFNCTSQA